MNNLQVFNSDDFGSIRVVNFDGEPWFSASDVCKALEIGNASQALTRLDDDERMTTIISNESAATGKSSMAFVNEMGLYSLVLGSRKEEAKAFKRWITHEVVPSIRKHGIYATDDVIDNILNNPDFGIKLLTELKEERAARVEAERKNAILTHVNKTYTATEIAKELGFKSAIELNKALAKRRIQFKQNGTWVFYSQYADKGYTEIKQEVLDNGKVIYHRKFTQIGRAFVLDLFGGEA